MFRILGCITQQHDLVLVFLAAGVCALGAFSTISLLNHLLSARTHRARWLAATAVSGGFAVWATHFIAMLAFTTPGETTYDVWLTLLSLALSVLLSGAGFARAMVGHAPRHRLEAGAIIGVGIAAMHFTGMAALQLPGHLQWSADLVVASLLLSPAILAAALAVGLDTARAYHRTAGASLFTIGVCVLHFTAMGAVTVVLDPTVAVEGSSISSQVLAIATAIAGLALLCLATLTVELNRKHEERKLDEVKRMRELADAAVEGLVITDGQVLLAANRSFEVLAGLSNSEGTNLEALFGSMAAQIVAGIGDVREGTLTHVDGEAIPVEVISRPISYDGEPRHAIAVRDLRERRKAAREIEFLALTDTLTGLPNRRYFTTRMSEMFAHGAPQGFAVVAIDLDRFKPVNDTLGHGVGDKLLRKVATRLKTVLRDTDVIARLGGDEFALLITSIDHAGVPALVAGRAVEILSRPFLIDGHLLTIGCSAGIAIYPSDGQSQEDLLKNADLALYRAKSEGRGRHAFFEHEMDQEMQRRRMLELDLHNAITRREFRLHYQPLQCPKSGRTTGYEALIRWQHPVKGLIPPDVFIPVAEETSLIIPIGEWALQTACKEASNWDNDLSIAVNLSPVQFRCPRLVASVTTALTKSGLAPHRLELEITETALLQDNAATVATLHKLQGLGVRISMDDFGTGYSSLSYLRSFPFNTIKIDRSFVRDLGNSPESSAIVRAIIMLGKSLGMTTTAEGVETAEQASILTQEGCDHLQGYFFGRPAPQIQPTPEVRERQDVA